MSIILRTLIISLGLALLAACNQPARSLAQLGASTPTPTMTAIPTATPLPTATPTPEPTATATLIPSLAPAPGVALNTDASLEELLAASIEAMSGVQSFHFELDASITTETDGSAMQIPLTFAGDYQAPDRTRGKMTISLGFLSMELETITIGDKAYISDPQTGEWEETSNASLVIPQPSDFTGIPEQANLEGMEVVGEETLEDGTPVLHLRAKAPEELTGGNTGDLDAHIWIGLEDSLIRRMKIDGDVPLDQVAALAPGAPFSGGALPSGPANLTMTVTLSNYNVPVEIEAPIP
jgi:hypothetical protein